MSDLLQVPENITFEGAIAFTQSLLDQLEQGRLGQPIGETVSKLLATPNGARGFFVAYLTDRRPLADQPEPELIDALKSSPSIVSELLVKNLAMSTAMALTHQRNDQADQAQQSLQVSRRSAELIQKVGGDRLRQEAHALWQSATWQSTTRQGATDSTGPYKAFLEKWGYDAEQKTAIAARLEGLLFQGEVS